MEVGGSVLSVLTQFLNPRMSLIVNSMSWWMVVGLNWLTWCLECHREVFESSVVPPVHWGAFLWYLLCDPQVR